MSKGVIMNQEELKKQNQPKGSNTKKDAVEQNIKIPEEELSSGLLKLEKYRYGVCNSIIPDYQPISGTFTDEAGKTQIKPIEIPSIDKFFLCNGATLKCPKGDSSPKLNILPIKQVFLNDQAIAVKSDMKPMVNIMPFGMCSSLANPTVAAATAANRGNLKKMPCIPAISAPWNNLINCFLVGEAVPCNKSTLMCNYGGKISIDNVGQKFIGKSNSENEKSDNSKEEKKEDEKNEEEEKFEEIKSVTTVKRKSYKTKKTK